MDNRLTDIGLLFIRIGIGLSYIFIHGWAKIAGGPERWEKIGGAVSNFGITYVPDIWGFLAAAAEFGGGILLLIGLFFRPALTLLTITMFVAASQHLFRGDGFMKAAYPLEMAVILIGLFIIGPGKYSLQNYFRGNKKDQT